jgi:hypothetical protein
MIGDVDSSETKGGRMYWDVESQKKKKKRVDTKA